ncbi:MAG: hypothetical protein Q8M96_14615 [Rubrivivax sp.]|nr:hypothetical protein [Rubrivivax sp.]
MQSMQVDHVIPESLLGEPAKLAEALTEFGLPATFDLQSFANWLPSCGSCNNRKRSHVFEPTPLIQLQLAEAKRKAPRAAELAYKSLSRQSVSRNWNTLLRAFQAGELPEDIRAAILEFAGELQAAREPAVCGEPLRITPLLQVIREDNDIRILRGPYGVGVSLANLANADSSWRCICGNSAWNGSRCVACGNMDDD